MTPAPTAVRVSGGARGTTVTYEALLGCAGTLSRVADVLLDLAARLAGQAPQPGVLLAASVAPVETARLEATLARVGGELLCCALRLQARAGQVAAAVAVYRHADALARGPGEQAPQVAGGPAHAAAVDLALDVVDLVVPGGLDALAGLAARLYPAGRGVAGPAVRSRAAPSRSVADLVAALVVRERAATGARQGEVELRRVRTTGRDGGTRTAWVVLLPGTRDWQLDPRRRTHLNDLRTSLDLVGSGSGARLEALGAGLAAAGARPEQPVMLVGHSQGGLLAAAAAARWNADGRHRVTHVLTTGAPVGRVVLPPQVEALSLENRRDVVPALDGARNPATRAWTTVDFTGAGGTDAAHSLERTYLPAARDVGAGADSVRAWVEGAQDFLAEADELVSVERVVVDLRLQSPRAQDRRSRR